VLYSVVDLTTEQMDAEEIKFDKKRKSYIDSFNKNTTVRPIAIVADAISVDLYVYLRESLKTVLSVVYVWDI
jgi:hypothetical protein